MHHLLIQVRAREIAEIFKEESSVASGYVWRFGMQALSVSLAARVSLIAVTSKVRWCPQTGPYFDSAAIEHSHIDATDVGLSIRHGSKPSGARKTHI